MTDTAIKPASDRLRPLLRTEHAPSRLNTLTTLTVALRPTGQLTLAYVADRTILTRDSFAAYAAAYAHESATPEALATQIVDDIANELVPRWQRVTLTLLSNGVAHTATVEDRQPGWNDSSLLAAANLPPLTKV